MSGWTAEQIEGKWADVYDPPGDRRPAFGLLYLHTLGKESLQDRADFARLAEEHRFACVSPHGMRCWWGDRVCAEFDDTLTPERHLLEHVVPYFESRWGLRPRSIAMLGISMGGQGALRLGFKHPALFPVVASISPMVDAHEVYGEGTPLDTMYDSKEQCRQDTAPMHLHPSQQPRQIFFCAAPHDAWHRGCERLHEKMQALGVPHEVELSVEGSHSFEYFSRMAPRVFEFLVESLKQESLRLL